jgi:hypothetical protein
MRRIVDHFVYRLAPWLGPHSDNLELRVLIDARLRTGISRPGNDVSDITSRHVPGSQMRDITESLMMLCEQASKEQDSEKLSNLVEEIIRLLAEKQRLDRDGDAPGCIPPELSSTVFQLPRTPFLRTWLNAPKWLLLVAAGRESLRAAAVLGHAAKDRGAPITSRIGEP